MSPPLTASNIICLYYCIRQHGTEVGFRKTQFLKPKLWVFWGSGPYWVFLSFYLNKQLGCLLVDLAHQLSFFRFANTLDYLKVHKFITFWSLEAVSIKKSLIITDTTN